MATILKPFGKRERVQLDCGDVRHTKQQFKAECDVNNIVAKAKKTGLVSHLSKYHGQYGDFSQPVDYQSALNYMMEASDVFMSLPATIRKKFDNDPGQFLAFAEDPANQDGMRELGLLPPLPKKSVDPVPPASDPAPEG